MPTMPPHRSEFSSAELPRPVWVQQQRVLNEGDAAEHARTVRALVGASILGALDHVGSADLKKLDIADRCGVTVGQLKRVFTRGDTGLHGCGFEYAVDAAINGSSAIPQGVRDTILTAVSGQVQLLLRDLGVPTDGWPSRLRSVMYGVERRRRPDWMAELETALGEHALLWPQPGADPVRLLSVLPLATPPRPRQSAQREEMADNARLPDNLSELWKADLLLGGANVRLTKEVRAAVPRGEAATAWVSASLKYKSRMVTAGAGLHLGIETSYRSPKRNQLSATIRDVREMPVITLPLDGAFVRAFNHANGALRLVMRSGMTSRLHPANATSPEMQQLGDWLGARRSQPAVQVAADLLGAAPDLFAVGNRTAHEFLDFVAKHEPQDNMPRRTLAAVPQQLAG